MILYNWVVNEIRRMATENPDKTAGDSYFNDDGTPMCIFGHMLHKLGAAPVEPDEDEVVAILNRAGDTVCIEGSAICDAEWEKLGVQYPSSYELSWSYHLQARQDEGGAWGEALRSADDLYPGVGL